MIAWGGSDNGATPGLFDSGGRYDPVGNSWASTFRGGAPSARRFHTAVWSGSSMIVWGGAATSDVNTGGLYDPVSNRWSDTSTINAPAARIGHTAVWAGGVMLIWGGETSQVGSFDAMNTGGRYDAVSNAWATTSLTGAPSARTNHSAVWTGTFMLVWGGVGEFFPGQGGRYVVNSPDGDQDGIADTCDCSPADPSVFAVPPEITGLSFAADKTTLSWSSATLGGGPSTLHDGVRGALAGLPVGGDQSAACWVTGTPAATAQDPSTPPEGTGRWYLVRGRNSCGAGTYGVTSNAAQRTTSACP